METVSQIPKPLYSIGLLMILTSSSAIAETFSLGVTAEALRAKID